LLPAILENFGPCVFGIAEHGGNEIAHLVLWRAGLLRRRLIGLLLVTAAVYQLGPANQYAWINTERPADQTEHDDSSNTEAASPDRKTHTTAAAKPAAVTPAVLDIVAAAEIIPTHREFLLKTLSQSSPKLSHASNFANFTTNVPLSPR
jgi:hypothetical protein